LKMFKMRLCTALAFIAVVVFPLQLECTITCQVNYVEGQCPVKLTSVLDQGPGEMYSECVTVRVWMKADDFCKAPKIEILSSNNETIKPIMKKNKNKTKVGLILFIVYACVKAEAETIVSVSYSTTSTSCTVSYTVPDPVPEFDLSVNQLSKSITVTVAPGEKVYTRWCYSGVQCNGGPLSTLITVSFNCTFICIYLLLFVYYTYTDARRRKKCPFQKEKVTDVADVWSSSEVIQYKSSLQWRSVCPASDLKISASLCWRQHEHLCTPVLNSTQLEEKEDGPNLIYNTSTVDKHPNMCVQVSQTVSSWDVYIGPGKQSVFVYITSLVPAMFSAQLCALNEMGCSPMGQVHTLRMGKTTEMRIKMPPHFLAVKPCVQVWQSEPALHGRRILCPNYTHNRCGMYAVAALTLVVIIALLGIFIHRLTKSKAADWLCVQKPVLLVCSSEQSAHVSAVCALASILQGELSATVHMALWAQSSQTQTGTGTGVADLGPLPWLYGQWETVRKAQGKVLIIWSPEAKIAYEKWREERANVDENERKKEDDSKADARCEKIRVAVEEDYKLNGRRLAICNKGKTAGRKDYVKSCDGKDWCQHKEPSSVIAPVFAASLACLQGTLQQCKGQGVAIVYFQRLGHSRDIPKALRGIPRYCLPQDFRGLIQELGGMKRKTQTGKFHWHCWLRLLSKVQSIWLVRQLAHRLQTQLPQTQGKKMQGLSVTSSQKKISDKTQSRLKLPLAASRARLETVQEQEPLHGSPLRAEKL
uniref:Uncharacterized LOC111217401 n=1 Tax=Seriola dumerili TaxID=41447 RepID=A0A3B4T6K8_SERDU